MAVFLCGRCGEELTRDVMDAFDREPPGRSVVVVCPRGHRSVFVEPLPGEDGRFPNEEEHRE
jgi:hypothetical protein